MLTVDNRNKIKIIQGDTGIINLSLDEELRVGDVVYFTAIDEAGQEVINKKIIEFAEGIAKIIFTKEDTANLAPGGYLYDIQVNMADGRIDTVVAPTKLTILGGITNA